MRLLQVSGVICCLLAFALQSSEAIEAKQSILGVLPTASAAEIRKAATYYSEHIRAAPEKQQTFTLALIQNKAGVAALKTLLGELSDPTNKKYGQWLSKEAVLDIVAPDPAVSLAVMNTLIANYDVPLAAITNGRDHLVVNTTTARVEAIFDVEMMDDGYSREPYIIPGIFAPYVVFVEGISGQLLPRNLKKNIAGLNGSSNGYVGREVMQRLYNIPNKDLQDGSIGLVEFQGVGSFKPSDLAKNQKENAQPLNPVMTDHIIGGNPGGAEAETSLDVQAASMVADNMDLWFLSYKHWIYEFATDVFKRENTPDAFSLSWGLFEEKNCDVIGCNDSLAYVSRCNIELLKLSTIGKTILVSSGDSGSPGRTYTGHAPDIRPAFPASSPYVLAIGGTVIQQASDDTHQFTTPLCKRYKCANAAGIQLDAMNQQVGWCSGASFSIFSNALAHQQQAIQEYVESGVGLPRSFNLYGRGVCDVTAVGHAAAVFLNGRINSIDGTSFSTPLWGGIIALLNDHQLSQNRSKLGLVAPLLYHIAKTSPGVFTRVAGNSASSEGGSFPIVNSPVQRSDFGFFSTNNTLWSPVSGLGAVNVAYLLDAMDAIFRKGQQKNASQ